MKIGVVGLDEYWWCGRWCGGDRNKLNIEKVDGWVGLDGCW